MDTTLSLGRQVLASQPFSVWLAAELLLFGGGHADISVPIRKDLTQQYGFVHGGVVSYAADNALAFAGGSILGSEVVTSEFKINYLRPAMGDALVARAAVVHAGKTQVVCRCDVFACRDGRVVHCATAQGSIMRRARAPVATDGGPGPQADDAL
jgi:uncharacterized protein (TIGR00369 family)